MEPYRERVAWPGWFYLVLAAALAVGIFGTAGVLARDGPGFGAGVALAALLVVAYVFWRLRYVVLELGPAGAAFGFGRLSRHVPADRIVSAEAEAYSVTRYMGWGYRMGWEARDRAYSVIGYGRGVRLVFDDERGRRWKVFLSCRDPDAAVAALNP
jgi:PGF-CTERM protein